MSEPPPPDEMRPGLFARLKAFVTWAFGLEARFLLRDPTESVSARFFRSLQVIVLAFRRYREDHASDRAASLAFSTILSMLPLLFLALAVMGWLSVDAAQTDRVKSWILEKVVPSAAGEVESRFNAVLIDLQRAIPGLGVLGIVLLVMTGGKLLSTLVRTFRAIWGNDPEASGFRRIAGFWGTVLMAPVLVLVSIVLTGFLKTMTIGWAASLGAQAVSLLVTWSALTTLYLFGPGRKVTFQSAAMGGIVAATAWEVLKTGFAEYTRHAFVATSVLSGMGVIPLFLLWLVLSWTLFVYGAEVAYVANDYERALERSGILREPPLPSSDAEA